MPRFEFVSDVDTEDIQPTFTYYTSKQDQFLLPKGGALLTSAGELKEKGIGGIIHVGSASFHQSHHGNLDTESIYLKRKNGASQMIQQFTEYEGPENGSATIQSIEAGIKNSVLLFLKHRKTGHAILRIPMVGGNIFLGMLQVSLEQLAASIVDTAVETLEDNDNTSGVIIEFVDVNTPAIDAFLVSLEKKLSSNGLSTELEARSNSKYGIVFRAKYQDMIFQVRQGSFDLPARDDYNVKQLKITTTDISCFIVNAANIEVKFGGGLSGAIGTATGEKEQINSEAQKILKAYYLNRYLPPVTTRTQKVVQMLTPLVKAVTTPIVNATKLSWADAQPKTETIQESPGTQEDVVETADVSSVKSSGWFSWCVNIARTMFSWLPGR